MVILTKDEITSRILRRWPDEIGEKITPEPIDLRAWRAARAPAIPEGLSRLQRERMEKKLRKGTLRAA
jgi:hypothetical protein